MYNPLNILLYMITQDKMSNIKAINIQSLWQLTVVSSSRFLDAALDLNKVILA